MARPPHEVNDEGGDPACWAARVCPACGLLDEREQRDGRCPHCGTAEWRGTADTPGVDAAQGAPHPPGSEPETDGHGSTDGDSAR